MNLLKFVHLHIVGLLFLVATALNLSAQSLQNGKFVKINGLDQWVTVQGGLEKPMVLFLHGGPGSVSTPYAANIFKSWERDFMVVNWDQRGAGRTYGRIAPEELDPAFLKANPLRLADMIADGVALTEYLLKTYGKEKLLLVGTSWGSVLGVKMAAARPELFHAYIGHAQVVAPETEAPQYAMVNSRAVKQNDTTVLKTLKSLGSPPYTRARDVGALLRIVKKYEAQAHLAPPANWFVPDAAYENAKDSQHRNDGDDYSFVNYVGDANLGVAAMRLEANIMRDHATLKLPVYIVQGKEDLLTPAGLTKLWFDKLKAPAKQYFLLEKCAHGFNAPVVNKLLEICKGLIVK